MPEGELEKPKAPGAIKDAIKSMKDKVKAKVK